MRIKPIITTFFGIAIAAGSVFVTKEHLLNQPSAASDAQESGLVEIYVAHTEIPFGQVIESHHVTVHLWPRAALPAGAFTDISQLIPADPKRQRRAKGRFFPGEVVIASKVSRFGEKVTLVQKLGENTRAMAVKVDAVTAVGGFVTPGDHVDIVLTQGAKLDLSAVTILQNIHVIGVDQQSDQSNDQPGVARTITVEVTPEQGQRLALAQKAGTLNMTLRTLDNVQDKPMEMVRLRDLLQEEGPVEKTAVQPTVTVRRGTQSEVVKITRTQVDTDLDAAPELTTEVEVPTAPELNAEPAQSELSEPVEAAELALEAELKPIASPLRAPRIRPISVTQKIEQ